jgi:pimeloyl-ACP methyl ester carboxylesterase
MPANSTTGILTHGAWADGSSWGKVILPLERHGLRVIAAPIPLTSLTDDVAALGRAIERTRGPVTLAAHAYAGGVISAVKHERIKSLVYVAALTPDKGESVGDVFYRGKPHPKAPQLAPDADGLIWMPEHGFSDAFAQNAPPTRLRFWQLHSGRLLCRAFKKRRPSRLGKRNLRGSWWRRKTA